MENIVAPENELDHPQEKRSVRDLPRYSVSKTIDEVALERSVSTIHYLASNENPNGSSPDILSVLRGSDLLLNRYPDGAGRKLKSSLADFYGVQSQNVLLGNGSNEVLECVAKAYLSEGDEVLTSEHSFAMYPLLSSAFGAHVISVPMIDWQVDLGEIAQKITGKTKIIFIANANNPTGTLLSGKAVKAFIERVPRSVIVVVDEAYAEYAGLDFTSAIHWLDLFPNLVVIRTFSKAYGLAGLRVGYGLMSPSINTVLDKVRQPFNINAIALAAADVALKDQPFLEMSIKQNKNERERISAFFSDIGFEYIPSETNFITFSPGALAFEYNEFLLDFGVVIRSLRSYEMDNWLRLSIGLPSENEAFMSVTQQWLENTK